MVDPRKVLNILRDKLILPTPITFANASGSVFVFCDSSTLHYWQIESVHFVPTTAYIGSQAALIGLGIYGTLGKYLATTTSCGTAAISQGVLSPNLLPVGSTPVLLAPQTTLVLSWTQKGAQSGVGQFIIRLRPEKPKNSSSRRPQDAQAAV